LIRGIVPEGTSGNSARDQNVRVDPRLPRSAFREQAQKDVFTPIKDVQELADTGHHGFDPATRAQ
jgi:hypothetical protein